MPLSEHEQRLLSQLEQQLLADDPRFASAMRGPARGGGSGRRMLVGAVALAVGLLLLILAVAQSIIVLGIAAFVLMLAGAAYALSSPKKTGGPTGVVGSDGRTRPARKANGRTRSSGTFMEKMEQRWQRRRDERWR